MLEGVLIGIAALLILMEVARNWQSPPVLDQPLNGMAVNGVAALLNAVWAFVLIRTGRSQKSPALIADGQHIMTDVVTSVGVLAGLVGVIATGWPSSTRCSPCWLRSTFSGKAGRSSARRSTG